MLRYPLTCLLLALFASTAFAQEAPEEPTDSTAAAPVTAPAMDPVPEPVWKITAGGTANLTEGNSSTRTFGTVLDGGREGARSFATLIGNAQYGMSRIPSRRPDALGDSPQVRNGTPGRWAFDENINNWLGQAKFGVYMTRRQTNYGYALQRMEGNRFAGFWLRYEAQVGYGRKIKLGEFVAIRLEVGPDFTEDRLVVNRIRSRFALAANALATVRLSENASLSEEVSHLRTVSSNDPRSEAWVDSRTRSTTSLVVKLTEKFQLQTGLLIEHASNPAPGAHPLDVNMTNAVMYSFL